MKRLYYYIADLSEGFGQTQFWQHCVRAENADMAKQIYAKQYFEIFGNYPISVSVMRTDKATFEDINNPQITEP